MCARSWAARCGIGNEITVTKQEVERRASMWGVSGEEFLSQSRLYLGDGVSESEYSFQALVQQPNLMRVHISRSVSQVHIR